MTPSSSTLNELEPRGQTFLVGDESAIITTENFPERPIRPAVISGARLLSDQISFVVKFGDFAGSNRNEKDTDDLMALRRSLGNPADDLDWEAVRKKLDF
jgi:hypothetical protein